MKNRAKFHKYVSLVTPDVCAAALHHVGAADSIDRFYHKVTSAEQWDCSRVAVMCRSRRSVKILK